jgi:predicted phage gp36 major capsid-like protein
VEALEALPERIASLELQVVQFREEVRVEFSALRAEMREQGEQIRGELRAEMRAGDEETRHLMRVLNEDVIARLNIIQEGQASVGGRGSNPARRPKR